MIQSFKCQLRFFATYIAGAVVMLFFPILYANIIVMDETPPFIFFAFMLFFVGSLFTAIFSQTFYSSFIQIALPFGVTRRNLYTAALLLKTLFGIFLGILVVVAVIPGALLSFGMPVFIPWALLPFTIFFSLFLTSLGTSMGVFGFRFGAKLLYTILAAVSIILIVTGILFMVFSEKSIVNFAAIFYSPWLCVICLCFCALLDIAGWKLIKNTAVRG